MFMKIIRRLRRRFKRYFTLTKRTIFFFFFNMIIIHVVYLEREIF